MADKSLTEGTGDGTTFEPGRDVTRAQLASFVTRFVEDYTGEPLETGSDRFDDVADDATHGAAIRKLREAGIVDGIGGNDFAPDAEVSRAQLASILSRALTYIEEGEARPESEPPRVDDSPFSDILPTDHADNIVALADVGVIAGFEDGTFGPHEPVRRGQMASLIMRGYDWVMEVDLGSDDTPEPPPPAPPEPDGVTNLRTGTLYDTFTDALTSADLEEGDVLEGRGEFDEDILVDTDDVTLQANSAVINGAGVSGSSAVIEVVADGVTLDGLEVHGYEPGTEDGSSSAVLVSGDDLTVTDLTITDIANTDDVGAAAGVVAYNAAEVVSGLTVTGTTVKGIGVPGDVRGTAVYLTDNDGTDHADVAIEGNTFEALAGEGPSGEGGIAVRVESVVDGEQVTIADNDISDAGAGAVGFELRDLDADDGAVTLTVGDSAMVDGDIVAVAFRDVRSNGAEDFSGLDAAGQQVSFCARDLYGETDHVGYFLDDAAAEAVCDNDDGVVDDLGPMYEYPWDWLFAGDLPNPGTISNFRVHFSDQDHGWAVGNDEIIHTDDAGASWTEQDYPAGITGSARVMRDVFFLDEDHGWSVGQHSSTMYTTDGGNTWMERDDETADCMLHAVRFIDDDRGLKVCGVGVFSSADGGANWTDLDVDEVSSPNSVTLVEDGSDVLAWVVGNDGEVAFSDDAFDGDSYQVQSTPTTERLDDVTFVDADTGFAVGRDGTVIATTDGGDTWVEQDSTVDSALKGVGFFDGDTGWAVGTDGVIIGTVDGGDTWSVQRSGMDRSLWSISVVDEDTAWIGGNRALLRLNR